jgi:glycosidase
MAEDTDKRLRNSVMYCIYVRQYSREGTFKKVMEDLGRIKELGTDYIWLMPIHPVGEENRKGTLGSPYAVRDYRSINPEFGTMEDFASLTGAIHDFGMKCVIDVVYNHVSPDSYIAKNHHEWLYRRPDGSFGSRIGDWTDVRDLDYSHAELRDYQIDTLKMWAKYADGFRCDVAPLVPLDFWLRARREVESVRPGYLWLAESVEPQFVAGTRARGIPCLSDGELYQAFDVCYEYDSYWAMMDYMAGKNTRDYASAINRQESAYPENYVKLRFLENHDRERTAASAPNEAALRSRTAFMYFQKGLTLVYNGQEREAAGTPSLFEKDPVDWNTGRDLAPLMRRLYEIKKDPIFAFGEYRLKDCGAGVLAGEYTLDGRRLFGVFSTAGMPVRIPADIPNRNYVNLIDGKTISVRDGAFSVMGEPAIIEI